MNGVFVRLSVILIVFYGTLAGCLGNRDWEYPPPSTGNYLDLKATNPIPQRVVVLPFEDLRGNEVQDEYWKIAVPLIPYGVTKYDRPETAVKPEPVDVINFSPPKDFAKATTSELKEARIFSAVHYAKNGKISHADLVLRGRLRSTEWKRSITSYGLGPVGSIFWIVGAPMGKTTTAVIMDLQLTTVDDPSNVLWEMSMEFEGNQLDGPYYGLEEAALSYPDALQEALRPAVSDLVQLADTDPERLQPGI